MTAAIPASDGASNNDSCDCRTIHPSRIKKAQQFDIEGEQLDYLVTLFKSLGEPGRLRILHALLHQEMCVCDLAAFLGSSESAVSHQLRNLRQTGFVANRREGAVLYYRIADEKMREFLEVACGHNQ